MRDDIVSVVGSGLYVPCRFGLVGVDCWVVDVFVSGGFIGLEICVNCFNLGLRYLV